ncbi:hypothetical protein ACE10Z_15410 [Bradyrhizobium sp. Pha-3]|uniref:hypothetical protein n=1 Tax=Bradyrhizobium sp. Pha-3 TaxID=208375 RepID=UPI0035D45CCC
MASPFGNACQPIEFAGGHLGHFFQMPFEIIAYQAGFDSAIPVSILILSTDRQTDPSLSPLPQMAI